MRPRWIKGNRDSADEACARDLCRQASWKQKLNHCARMCSDIDGFVFENYFLAKESLGITVN